MKEGRVKKIMCTRQGSERGGKRTRRRQGKEKVWKEEGGRDGNNVKEANGKKGGGRRRE